MLRVTVISLVLLALGVTPVWADSGTANSLEPANLWRAWNWDLLVLLNLGLLSWCYHRGIGRLRQKRHKRRFPTPLGIAAFGGSLVVLFVALISPLHSLSESLAAAHMVQHMLLMVVAAPLFVLGSPAVVLTSGMPRSQLPLLGRCRRWLDAKLLWQPWFAGVVYALALWLWHLPAAYQAALVDPLIHDTQHITFFVAACMYWRVLLDPVRRSQLQPIAAFVLLFTTALHAMVLGVFMALSPVIWYGIYRARTQPWGLTPLEDQQLAGLIMWMPACLIYPAAAAAIIGRWLNDLSAVASQPSQQPLQGA
jgi:putative membrane protein